MLRVCLTGGIASGKSLVTDRFAALGVPVADSDVAAREVVQPGSDGLARVVAAFGPEVVNEAGQLDRKAMRRRIFADEQARARLEGLLHPLIAERVAGWLRTWAERGEPYALQSVPLLVETGMDRDCTRVLVVDAPERVQVERLVRRDGCSEEEARSIIAQQASRWQRLAAATDVIDNGDGVAAAISVAPQVTALHRKFRALADAATG